ncbi:MAG: hypothetical protein JNM93_00895 [Bacteriovoracaceae bacterium]|nr:hypothetical protein [Bacteriovoracaceae bacterium]
MKASYFIFILILNFVHIGCDSTNKRVPSSIEEEKETQYPTEPVNHLKEEDEIQVV